VTNFRKVALEAEISFIDIPNEKQLLLLDVGNLILGPNSVHVCYTSYTHFDLKCES
jgi:hypothetical protein